MNTKLTLLALLCLGSASSFATEPDKTVIPKPLTANISFTVEQEAQKVLRIDALESNIQKFELNRVLSQDVQNKKAAELLRGGDVGNGGGGIHCRDAQGSRTELLDLYDAEKGEYGELTIVRSEKPWREQLIAAIVKYAEVRPHTAGLVLTEFNRLENEDRVHFLTEGPRLMPPKDTNLSKLDAPRACSFEGVAQYNDSDGGNLVVDAYHYNLMSQTDIAALYFHEAVYKVLRNSYATFDSTKARKITALVFAEEQMSVTRTQGEIEENTISVCETADESMKFFVNKKSDSELEISISRMNSVDLSERTASTIDTAKETDRFRTLDFYSRLKDGFVKSVQNERSDFQKLNWYGWYETGAKSDSKNNIYQYVIGNHSKTSPYFQVGFDTELGPRERLLIRPVDFADVRTKRNIFGRLGLDPRDGAIAWHKTTKQDLTINFKLYVSDKRSHSKLMNTELRKLMPYFGKPSTLEFPFEQDLQTETDNLTTTCQAVR